MPKLTARETCLVHLAATISDIRFPEQIAEYETMAEYYDDQLERGHTLNLVLGGEGDGWSTQVENFRVGSDERPLVLAMIALIDDDPRRIWGNAELLAAAKRAVKADTP